MGEVSPIAPIDVPSPLTGPPTGAANGAPSAAPSAFGHDASQPGPSVAVAQYNPRTGSYVAPDGQVYRQSDLVAPTSPKTPKTWKDMFAT
jgi:hypothetical protein